MHIPDDPGYYEKFYFTPGDLGFKSINTKYGRIGSLVCWDQWFPEAARLTALKGAEILFYPTAIGWHPKEKKKFGKSQLDAWITIQRSHAIANGVFVAAINRTGLEKIKNKKIQFWGNSIIIDPNGNIIKQAKDTLGEENVTESFVKNLSNALQNVSDNQLKSAELTKNFELGIENDLTKVMIQQQLAGLGFQMTLNVRNKVLSAYKDIMNMPV